MAWSEGMTDANHAKYHNLFKLCVCKWYICATLLKTICRWYWTSKTFNLKSQWICILKLVMSNSSYILPRILDRLWPRCYCLLITFGLKFTLTLHKCRGTCRMFTEINIHNTVHRKYIGPFSKYYFTRNFLLSKISQISNFRLNRLSEAW